MIIVTVASVCHLLPGKAKLKRERYRSHIEPYDGQSGELRGCERRKAPRVEVAPNGGHLLLFREKESTMPRTRPPYSVEFRQQMVELVKTGRTPEELSREFEPTAQTIHNWVKQSDLDTGVRSDGLTSSELEELRSLRRENKRLRIEREILKKAAAWFAQETDSVPPRRSSS